MPVYGAFPERKSDRNGHVRRPQKGGKTTTTAVQGFWARRRAHKSDIYGAFPEGKSDRNGAVPALLTLGDLPGFLTKDEKHENNGWKSVKVTFLKEKWPADVTFKVP